MATLCHPEHFYFPGKYALPIVQSQFYSITTFLKYLAPISVSAVCLKKKKKTREVTIKFITDLELRGYVFFFLHSVICLLCSFYFRIRDFTSFVTISSESFHFLMEAYLH